MSTTEVDHTTIPTTSRQSTADSNQEWEKLKELRAYRGRLFNQKKYQPLDKQLALLGNIHLRNEINLLEDGLRYVMRRNDLDVHFQDGLDKSAMVLAQESLTSLCCLLESIVNDEILDSELLGTSLQSACESRYPRLDSLLHVLGATTWQFEMCSGTAKRLFTSTSPMEHQKKVDLFNQALSRLTQPNIEDIQLPEEKEEEEKEELGAGKAAEMVSEPQNLFHGGMKALGTLLMWVKNLINCPGCHKILVQLPEWDPRTSHARFRREHLDLFLTTCGPAVGWQESRLNYIDRSTDQSLWASAEDLCDDLHGARMTRERLDLAAVDTRVLILDKDDSDANSECSDIDTQPPGQQPSKNLKQLLEDGAFFAIDANVWIPGSRSARFEQTEKRNLATALVISLALTLDSDHIIRAWDPEAIYFPANSNGIYIRDSPYALCESVAEDESQETKSESQPKLPPARFRFLARLLLEIESGVLLKNIPIGNGTNGGLNVQTLDDVIFDELQQDLTRSRVSYLRAVQKCLNFEEELKRKIRHMAARGRLGGQTDAVRSLTYAIVQRIQGSVLRNHSSTVHSGHERRNKHNHPATKALDVNWPAISDDIHDLGLAAGAEPSYTAMFRNKHLDAHMKKTSSRPNPRKLKVQFIDAVEHDGPGVHEGTIGVRVQIESAVDERVNNHEQQHSTSDVETMAEAESSECAEGYELFGEENSWDTETTCRKVAKKWIKEFKTLRSTNKIGRGSAQRMKVAVLDTGIDVNHYDISKNIEDHHSFVDGQTIVDKSGHGTHIAGIILDLTPNVDLYVGKVIDSRSSPDRGPIVRALRHAREVWKVDIISLSFGIRIPSNPDLVQQEIEQCINAGIIVFASASNDGGNKPRTYPGDYTNVMCIHSATGEGNKSTFNPTPQRRKDNFSVVGDGLLSCWPLEMTNFDIKVGKKYLSGTSIATPVAVSIAAFMIGYIRQHMAEYDWNIKPWCSEGMQRIFRDMVDERDGYDWVSPEWYFSTYGDKEIKERLGRILRGYIRSKT